MLHSHAITIQFYHMAANFTGEKSFSHKNQTTLQTCWQDHVSGDIVVAFNLTPGRVPADFCTICCMLPLLQVLLLPLNKML